MTPLSSSSSRGEAHRAHVPHEENEPDLVLVCAPLSAETVTAARRRQTAHDDNIVRTKQRNEDEHEEEKKKTQARLFFVLVATTIVIAAPLKTRGARDGETTQK
jgi:hypothetical protein